MDRPRHIIESLPVLILYPHSRCNCRCLMCDIWKVTTEEEISPSDLQRHAADIGQLAVQWVVFSGGEPLMHSDLFRLSRLLRARGIRTTALTTGLLLKRDAAKIVDALDDIIVSLDGPPNVHDRIRNVRGAFERLERGVQALQKLRPDYPVAGRCTVQRANHGALRQTVATAMRLRLQSISFLAADLTSTAFNRPVGWSEERHEQVALTAREISALEEEIEALVRDQAPDVASGFVAESPAKLRRIVRHFRAHLGLADPAAPRCNAPWVSAVVETDGTVRPCFFHRPIGNAKTHGLLQVLNSPKAVAFRASLDIARHPICRRCVCSLHWSTDNLTATGDQRGVSEDALAGGRGV